MPAVTGREKPLSELMEILRPQGVSNFWEVRVDRIVADSRDAARGSLFVAIPGENVDGAEFALAAVMKGAVAVVAERVLPTVPGKIPLLVVEDARYALSALASHMSGDSSNDMNVIGVTGTNGKTTTTHFLRSIFEVAGVTSGLIGTNSYLIGDLEIGAAHTTPDPLSLHYLFRELRDRGAETCAMEVSSHALAQSRVAHVDFDVAVFTNLTPEHMEYHSGMDDYRRAKARLFEMVRPDAACVLNIDDPGVGYFAKAANGAVVTYGLSDAADFYATGIALGMCGSAFTLNTSHEKHTVRINLPGRYNVYNALGAVAAAHYAGFPLEAAVAGIESLKSVRGRLEAIEGEGFTVFIDYAHSSDALENVLKNLRGLVKGRIITVFGCGGDRGKEKRPLMGRTAAEYSDYCIVTSDNPRSEDPYAIIEDILRGFGNMRNCGVASDRARAIGKAVRMAGPGDAVLIAGKGHEDCQIFAGGAVRFDDAEEVRKALEGRRCGSKERT